MKRPDSHPKDPKKTAVWQKRKGVSSPKNGAMEKATQLAKKIFAKKIAAKGSATHRPPRTSASEPHQTSYHSPSSRPPPPQRTGKKSPQPFKRLFSSHRERTAPTIGKTTRRLEILAGLFMLAFVILVIRAFDLTILQGEALQRIAQNQHKKKLVVQANRGRFLDRNDKPLAVSLPMQSLSVDRDLVKDPQQLAAQLAPLIGQAEKQLLRKLLNARPGTFPVLRRKLPPEAIRKIRMLNHEALFFKPDSKRFYTLGEVTSHLLGFVNFDGEGAEGLERTLDKDLQGQNGLQIVTRDRLGRLMPKMQTVTPAEPGTDISLTIDTTIQYIAYRALLKGVTTSQAKAGFVIIMDPRNGEMLALVNQPSFNPNNLRKSKASGRRNRAVYDLYEPGSTFKIFTAAAALETRTVTPDTIIDIEGGKFRVGDRTIRDFHQGDDQLTVQQIMQKSSNVGAAKIGLKTGNDAMERYIYQFGFGAPTGIELGHEPNGGLADITFYKQVGLANRSYGYGVTATPLQLITAAAAAINGGIFHPPQLVRGTYKNETFLPAPKPTPHRVISEETSATLRKILESVVEPDGTAPRAAIHGYRVAGKTGTARKALPGKGYVSGYYYASFIGFIPADKPELIIFVGIDEPQGSYYGGLVAAPIFREIAHGILPLLSIFPTQETALQLPEMARESSYPLPGMPLDESLTGTSLELALNILRHRGIIPLVKGSGLVEQYDATGEGPPRLILK